MEIMKIIGYESCFTRHSNESRIFIDKAFIKKRGYGLENIAIYINRYSESCKSFHKIDKKGNVYTFNFYCHSNHREICELLRILKPESMTFLFSEIDKSKLSYDFKFKFDFPRTVLFSGTSTKPSMKVEDNMNKRIKNSPKQLIQSSITNDTNVSKYLDSDDKRLVQNTLENTGVTNLSKDFICPLRIRKVPEINNTGLHNEFSCIPDGENKVAENVTCKNKLSYNSSKDINNSDKNTSNFSVQSHSSLKSIHNYAKSPPNNTVKLIKLTNSDSAEKTLISNNLKSSSSCVVKTKAGGPLVFHSRLVKENRLNGIKAKVVQVSNSGMPPNGKKSTIIVNSNYTKKPVLITVPANDIQKTKLKDLWDGNDIATKKHLIVLKSKTADSNPNLKQPNSLLQPTSNVLNLTKLFHDWMDNDMVSVPNEFSQTSENSVDEPEESISYESYKCDSDSIQLKSPKNNTANKKRNSDLSINLRKEHDIDRPSKAPTEFHLLGKQGACNKKSDNNSTMTLKKSLVDNRARKSTNDQELESLSENTCKNDESKFVENNYQVAPKDASTVNSKRHLSDNENGQSRKKLRSDNVRQSLKQSSWLHKEGISLRHCSILVLRNSFEKTYFYSSKNDCYLPKFYGFKKHEVKPRNMLASLRNLQKLIIEIKCN